MSFLEARDLFKNLFSHKFTQLHHFCHCRSSSQQMKRHIHHFVCVFHHVFLVGKIPDTLLFVTYRPHIRGKIPDFCFNPRRCFHFAICRFGSPQALGDRVLGLPRGNHKFRGVKWSKHARRMEIDGASSR